MKSSISKFLSEVKIGLDLCCLTYHSFFSYMYSARLRSDLEIYFQHSGLYQGISILNQC